MKQSPLQRKATETILNQMQYYLDMRKDQVCRINPKMERAWEDISWQEITRLHATLSMDKPYGPVRHHMAELLLSDDEKKIYDLLSSKGQYSLLGEVIEEREAAGKKTEGQTEIHDARTLFHAIDPELSTLITLIQTYIWWDLPDGITMARYTWKSDRVRNFHEKGVTDEIAQHYMEVMGLEKAPSKDQIIQYEHRMIRRTMKEFRKRREEERNYTIIVRRETTDQENPETLIEALAAQNSLLRKLKSGEDLDESVKEQFAKVFHCAKEQLSPQQEIKFLTNTVQANRKRLKDALNRAGSGAPYNLKEFQSDRLEEKFKELSEELGLPFEDDTVSADPVSSH